MKKALEVMVSIGAAVVIIGAWAKITHKPYADTLLTIGLLTEAAIFVAYSIEAFFSKKEISQTGSGTINISTDRLSDAIEEQTKTLKSIYKTH